MKLVIRLGVILCAVFAAVTIAVFALMLVFAGVESRQDQVLATLGKYDSKEFWTHGAFQDYTDYAKYQFSSVSFEGNPYFSVVSESDLPIIRAFLDNFEKWVASIKETDAADELAISYDFDRSLMDAGDFFYLYEDEDYPKFGCYDLYFFDSQTQVLYYFHSNI